MTDTNKTRVRRKDDAEYQAYIKEQKRLYRQTPAYKAARTIRRRIQTWRKFGGTPELFKKRWKEQKGCCGICGLALDPESQSKVDQPQFDHCHTSMRPRGILCSACNLRLGWYEMWYPEIRQYLERYKDGTL